MMMLAIQPNKALNSLLQCFIPARCYCAIEVYRLYYLLAMQIATIWVGFIGKDKPTYRHLSLVCLSK